MSVVSTLSDQEALERFKESQPDLRTVAQIARLTEEQFVQAHGAGAFFAGDLRQARRVYWTAVNVNAKNALIWANIKDAAASPFYRATLFNNIPQEFISYLEKLPGYQRLFSNLDFVECDHCRSVFGPAAYFVDLVRFVQDFVAGNTAENQKLAFPIDGDDPARRRRPDLFTFPLDCANTHDLIPAIDLVNEVLEAVVRSPQQPDALRVLDETNFPWAVPYSRPLAEIRQYLGQVGLSLSTVYDAYLRRETSDQATAAARHIDREYLQLSPREAALIAREATDPQQIGALFGGSDRYDLDALAELPVFLEQTGLDRKQVNELLYQDLDRSELNAGLSRLFFINNVDDGLGPLTLVDGPDGARGFDERLVNLSYAKLDRIHRFVRLARKLGWSFTDLDMALRSLAEPFEPASVLTLDGIDDYVACRNVTGLDLADFTVEAWINPSQHGNNVILAKGQGRDWHILFLVNPDGKLAFYDQASQQLIAGVSRVPLGVFSHVAVTVSGADLRFYLDGQPDGPVDAWGKDVSLRQAVSPLGADLDIGRNLIDAYFAGQITEVRIWQGAAGQAAIADGRYRRLTGLEPGLAGYWPLTENPYDQLFDLTANRNDGVMGGSEFVTQPVWVQRDLMLEPAPEAVSAKAYRFDGIDQYLAARHVDGAAMAALTLEAWVKWEPKAAAEEQEIIAKGQESTGQTQFRLTIDEGGRLLFRSTSLSKDFRSREALTPRQWTHVAVALPDAALDGPTLRWFADPKAVDSFKQDVLGRFDGARRDDIVQSIEQAIGRRPQRRGVAGVSAGDFEDALISAIGKAVLATPTSQPGAPVETPDAFIEEALKNTSPLLLTEDNMDALVSPRVPTDVYGWLEQVQAEQDGKEFKGYDAFVAALQRAIGADVLAPWRIKTLHEAEVRCLRIYLDGRPQQFELGQGPLALAEIDAKAGDTITVGRKLTERPGYRYFQGWLKELRVWSQVRTAEQLALGSVRVVGAREPGLAGYWRFDEVVDGQARDLSSLGNHLFLGGILADYMPQRVAVDYLLPPLPVAVAGRALVFDGQNTLVEVQDPLNRSLGAYDRLTLALWFNAADVAASREQILYAQGDAEDGLAIVLSAGVLTVAAWANTFEGDALQTVVFKTVAGQIASNTWHHVAVSKDEEPSADAVAQKLVRYTVYLDGAPFGEESAPFRLCPVGPSWLGGLASDAVIWSETLGTHASNAWAHHFTGMLTDLRVWRKVKSQAELAIERFVAPVEPDADLILYLPLTETSGPVLVDGSGLGSNVLFRARNMVLAAQPLPAGLDEARAHYADPAALGWTNYAVTGRLRSGAADGAIGVTFFSRYPQQVDRCYALRRDKDQPTFALTAHPPVAPPLRGKTDSQVTPQAGEWHRFRIEASVEADRTRIRARVWPESAAEPADFPIDAYDASSLRLTAGTVGLWAQGDSQPAFDQIEVYPLAAGPALLVADFDRLPAGQAPVNWQQTGARSHYPGRNDLFRTIALDGNTTYGADLPEEGNISLLAKRGALKWTNYTVRGQVMVTEEDGGVGVVVLAQGKDQYYVLRRAKDAPAFALHVWPAGLQTLAGRLDSGVVPVADVPYSFKIKTEATATETRIQAKVWPSDDGEPASYQIDAVDASEVRLRAGTIGVWAGGPGLKCIDSVIVSTVERKAGQPRYTVLHSESFRSYRRGRKPSGWRDSGAVDHFAPQAAAFLGGEAQAGVPRWQAVDDYPVLLRPLNRRALAFDGKLTYAAAEKVAGLEATQFTVEAWIKPQRAGAGPILSQHAQPGAASTLQLGLDAAGRLALSYGRPDGALETLAGATALTAGAAAHVAVSVNGSAVQFYLNGQPDGSAAASAPLALGGASLELGRGVDLTAGAPVRQVFGGEIRDLRVWRGAFARPEQLAAERFQRPELTAALLGYWPFDEEKGPTTADQSPSNDNALRLGGIEAARRPVLQDPSPHFAMPALADPAQDAGLFDPACLKLDGVDDYAGIALAPAAAAAAATWEAWVRPAAFGAETTLWEQNDRAVRLGWQGNRLAVTLAGNDPATQTFDFGFDADAWAHVAVAFDSAAKSLALFVDGNLVERRAYTSSAALDLAAARVGLNQLGQAGLRGLVKELRLWSAARTEEEIRALLFRRLTGAEPNLLLYRPFNEQASLEHAPAWVGPDLLADGLGQGFFRPQRKAVAFAGQDVQGLVHWAGDSAAPCQRRTVEVWFKADDVRISRRKQVIFHEGDERQGLAIYLFDGRLYFGGYSRLADTQAWAHWAGTWLSTARVRSGKWHHAAIVLDGRDEVRDGSFQAYLDGKLVDDGLGAQLARCAGSRALGRAAGAILFHDGTMVEPPAPAPLPALPSAPGPAPTPAAPPLTPEELDKTAIPLGKPQRPFAFPSQAFTVECWINPALSRYQGSPISYAVSKENDNAFVLYLYGHRELTVVINEQRISASGVASLDPNRWQHVAVTWQASDGQIQVYKDGQTVYSGKVARGRPAPTGGSLVFGQEQDRPGGELDPYEVFHGKLNEVRIWDHVRTAEQIRAGMNQRLPGAETGLAARWPADAAPGAGQPAAPAGGSAAAGGAANADAAAANADSAAGVAQQVDGALFAGQILDLRIWTTARSQRQLDVYRYRQLRATDAADGLDLWWQFEEVADGQIHDLSGKGHAGALTPPAQIREIGGARAHGMPRARLDEDGLGRLANLKRLMTRYRLPMDRLTALWHEIRHTGRADGRTLWDDTFNPAGAVLQPWPAHIDQPLRWDMSGATGQEESRRIRSRLMGALRISHEALNLLAATLSGEGETIVELDGAYLTNLYRLARLPGLLRLSVPEFERLLALMQLARVDSLDTLVAVSERADWMQRTGIDVFELDFLANDTESERVAFPYTDATIRDLADSLRRQSGEILARANSFVTAEVGELASAGLFKLMQPGSLDIVDSQGAVRPDYEPPAQFERLVFLAPAGDPGDARKLELNLTQAAFARLTQAQLDQLTARQLIAASGLVLDGAGQTLLDPAKADFGDARLKQVFPAAKADELLLIREALERALKIQSELAARLLQLRDGLGAATLAGLSALAAATPDRTLAVLQHLGPRPQPAGAALSSQQQEAQQQLAGRATLKRLFDILMAIGGDQRPILTSAREGQSPIPVTLTGRPDGYLYQLSKILFLAGQFGLTVDEIAALVEDPARFSVKNILRPDLADLTNLYRFASLKVAFGDSQGKLLKLLSAGGATDETAAAIHALTGWEERQIRSLLAFYAHEIAGNRLAGLERLRTMFELAATLHVDAGFFTAQLAETAELSYGFYARLAANLLEIVRSHYDDEQWARVQRPIHDRLAVQTRDALLGRAMLAISPDFAGRRSPDVLSEYLLLDVQTGSEVDTSRMVQAIASLQLYVQRCMMNLERGIDPASIPAGQWQWMKNYRVWEANRKVFLYPENYIEPELRDTKTPFFAELEQDLLQGEINADLVEKAYVRYLDKFAEVANLKIVGSYFEGNKEAGTLYLLGRTRTDPKVYYLRQHVEGKRWTPWQQISISIEADFATPVFAFNRLFVFWVEFTKIVESRPVKADFWTPKDKQDAQGYKLKVNVAGTQIREEENIDVFKASIRYTYLNLAGEWVQPQVFMELGRHLEKHEIIRPEWQRPYLQRSLETLFSPTQQQVIEPEQAVKVLHIEAGQPKATELKATVPGMAMNQLTWSFLANFTANPLPDAAAENQPGGQTLRLIYYDNKRAIRDLLKPDEDFLVTVTDNVVRIPGSPHVGAARQVRDAAQSALDALKARTNPSATAAELTAMRGSLDAAQQALDAALAAPKWQTADLTLHVAIGANTVAQTSLSYGRWQQIAVTLDYDYAAGAYAVELLIDGQSKARTPAIKTRVFTEKSELTIGQGDVPSHFATQMSEFRLWRQVRSAADLTAERDQRKTTSLAKGLFQIGLDRPEGRADLNVRPSQPALGLHRVSEPEPPAERERILLLWGKDIRKGIRNTLQTDESFNMTLEVQSGTPPSYDLDLAEKRLYVLETPEFSINDYAAGQQSTLSRFRPDVKTWLISAANRNYVLSEAEFQQFRAMIALWSAFGVVPVDANNPDQIKAFLRTLGIQEMRFTSVDDAHTLLKQVSSFDASFIDVNNQPGWYIVDTGDEQFLIKFVAQQPLRTATERLKAVAGANIAGNPQPYTMHFELDEALAARPSNPWSDFRVEFTRLSTFVVHDLSQDLFTGGIEALLSLKSQGHNEIDFDQTYEPNRTTVIPPGYDRATGKVRSGIDFDGAYGLYYREIFFHIPFFIANQLNTNQNFADAQKWYHTIFNPTVTEAKDAGVGSDRYWQFRPFRGLSLETLRQMLTNQEALEEYRQDPFDPHAIARLRINAYQKAIVMKYIDNLLDWGDNLFSQDTRESINEAAQLYLLAYNLLGPRPKSKAIKELRAIGTLEDVLARQGGLPDFFVELDRRGGGLGLAGPAAITPNNGIVADFGVIENEQFMGYWDRVEDRLYKIRHSLNIEGTFRQLALFQPSINPADLVRAVAGGRDLGSVLADLNVPVPHYRFAVVWQRAKDIASTVSDLGSALLDALEKKDVQALAILQNVQDEEDLNLAKSILDNELKIAEETIEALHISKESIQARFDRFDRLIANGLIAGEHTWLVLKGIALGLKVGAGAAKVVKEATGGIPDAEIGGAGFGGSPTATITFGGSVVDAIPGMIAEGLDAAATALEDGAEIAAKVAENERRAAEWAFEKTIAGHELKEIDKQLAIAGLQLEIVRRQIVIHTNEIKQNNDTAEFYRSKFSNQDLYTWMINRLSGLHFQAYRLAYEYAKAAEKALQFELPTTQSFISFGHWDSLKKGLLAGESLKLELDRMEKAHLNQDSRFQEIEKQISMQRSLPEALAELIRSGKADFQLGEALFNRDFPGHYARMIKTIGISLKTSSEVSPYDSLYATLIQLGSRTLLEPNIDAVRYLMGVDGADQPDANVLRTNWRANQQVAISKVDEEDGDDGMFALDFFFDNRYFPFEGTGAVSAWRLEIAKEPEGFDRSSISDVIIHLRYTAKYDSGGFKQAVANEMRTYQAP